MKKILVLIALSLFIQSLCESIIYDGSRLKELSYSIDQDYDASILISMNTFNQEMISYYSWFAS